MKNAMDSAGRSVRGIAALFDDFERKELFRKYLFFIGWVELLIFASCWLYQLGDAAGPDHAGPVDIAFPWKAYFLVSFLAPVVITFIVGVIIVGFNTYFAEAAPAVESARSGQAEIPENLSGRVQRLLTMVNWLQRLPFLGLLLLLSLAAIVFYKLDVILAVIGSIGEKSVKVVLISAAVLVGLASLFALILIVLNFQLRKKSMEYQYKSEMAERFGLIILDNNTVLNREGKLLVQDGKSALPLLPSESCGPSSSASGSAPAAPDAGGPKLTGTVDVRVS